MTHRASVPLHRTDEPERGCGSGFGDGCGHGNGHRHGRGGEAGYTMVMFVVIIAIMSIAMGVAVQTAEFQMRREREAELIFRGTQFIEAIRLYKTKYGRYPMQLKEIYEAKPRVIRKKWKDPITDSEDWGLIFLGQDGRTSGQQGRQLAGPGGLQKDPGSGQSPMETQTPFGEAGTGQGGSESPEIDPQTGLPRSSFGDAAANRKMGPIIGVHSKSTDEAIKVYEGHTTYSEWKFVYREEQRQGRSATRPRQPPVGWHPGDKLPQDNDSGTGPGSGSEPPPPIATVPRP